MFVLWCARAAVVRQRPACWGSVGARSVRAFSCFVGRLRRLGETFVRRSPADRSVALLVGVESRKRRQEPPDGGLIGRRPGPSKTTRNSASFPTASAGVGGLRSSVRIVLDSAGCQSYQCPSLGTCASVFPQSGVSESARSCVRFGSAGHRASMASRRSIFRRVCLSRLGVRKQTSDRSYLGQLPEECPSEEYRSRGGLDLQTAADHFCWTTLRRANGFRAASDSRWCSSIGRAPVL